MNGHQSGTHGRGARKKGKGSGHRGGVGMAGSGKRADQKKTLINKKYGHGYFGKSGITSKRTAKDKRDRINLQEIFQSLDKYKKTSKGYEIDLSNYKILGKGEISEKLIITAKEASTSALEKVRKAGGEIILKKSKNKEEKIAPKKQAK